LEFSKSISEASSQHDSPRGVFVNSGSEFSPELRYTKDDIKYSRIDKDYRTGTFRNDRPPIAPKLGNVNTISPEDYKKQKTDTAADEIRRKQVKAYMI
jgi:hypothetical protein